MLSIMRLSVLMMVAILGASAEASPFRRWGNRWLTRQRIGPSSSSSNLAGAVRGFGLHSSASPNSAIYNTLRGGAFSQATTIRVAYQGEPGAYSEKATRELLNSQVTAIGHSSFEACFRAVSNLECDYACLPVENSLGGSIHENYDLLLRYDLTIIAEHEFRVQHCLLARPGVALDQIKFAVSHPQALAQCDGFLRGLGIVPKPMYDTAGSAKLLSEDGGAEKLPDGCTPQNTASIASDLAGETYGMTCLKQGIEDDDSNFTRFLLLARKSVVEYLTKAIPTKTSLVFTLKAASVQNAGAGADPGSLYKAMACFALRDIDLSKIESRPTSASLLNFLRFQSQTQGETTAAAKSEQSTEQPRFRYCFYVDILARPQEESTQNALAHLREQSGFLRVLGSYPTKSQLVGPVATQVAELKQQQSATTATPKRGQQADKPKPLNIGVVGFGFMGRLLASRLTLEHRLSALDKEDKSAAADDLGVEFYQAYEMASFLAGLDIVILAVPLMDLERAVKSLPVELIKGKLLVQTCKLMEYPKSVLMREFGDNMQQDIDLLSLHPMVGLPSTLQDADEHKQAAQAKENPFAGRPLVYDKIRIQTSGIARCQQFLKTFEEAQCQLTQLSAEQHDESVASGEFLTLLLSQLLTADGQRQSLLAPTPVASLEYQNLQKLAALSSGDPAYAFDILFGMFQYRKQASQAQLEALRENLAALDRQLAAKEAYLQARADLETGDRQRLLAETKQLFREIVSSTSQEQPTAKKHSAMTNSGTTNGDDKSEN